MNLAYKVRNDHRKLAKRTERRKLAKVGRAALAATKANPHKNKTVNKRLEEARTREAVIGVNPKYLSKDARRRSSTPDEYEAARLQYIKDQREATRQAAIDAELAAKTKSEEEALEAQLATKQDATTLTEVDGVYVPE